MAVLLLIQRVGAGAELSNSCNMALQVRIIGVPVALFEGADGLG